MTTATTARIRRIIRDVEYAVAKDVSVKTNYPSAKPVGFQADAVIESYFDQTADAQILLNEKFGILRLVRQHEAAEANISLGFGGSIPLAPTLPRVRMVDKTRGLNRVMLLKGVAYDRNSGHNAIEVMG